MVTSDSMIATVECTGSDSFRTNDGPLLLFFFLDGGGGGGWGMKNIENIVCRA